MLSSDEREFLLIPKSLPTGSHYANLRKFLGQTKWDKIRRQAYERAEHKCELCNSKPSRLEAHELWFFDFENKVQYLKRIVVLCSKCHSIQHAMLLALQHDQGIKNADVVVKHYNKLTNQLVTYTKFFSLANDMQRKFENIDWDVVVVKDFEELLSSI